VVARLPYRRTIIRHRYFNEVYFHEVRPAVQLMLTAALNFCFRPSCTLNQNAARDELILDESVSFLKFDVLKYGRTKVVTHDASIVDMQTSFRASNGIMQ
jgi:hypothetical protein